MHPRAVSITPTLTLHSFRSGTAQHVNSDHKLSAQWILDRGGWQLSAATKVFVYIVNTIREDQRVGKNLSGWHALSCQTLPSLEALEELDTTSKQKAEKLRHSLFTSSLPPFDEELTMYALVAEVLTAIVVLHFPAMIEAQSESPYVRIFTALLGYNLIATN